MDAEKFGLDDIYNEATHSHHSPFGSERSGKFPFGLCCYVSPLSFARFMSDESAEISAVSHG